MPECRYRASIGSQNGGFPLKTRGNDAYNGATEQLQKREASLGTNKRQNLIQAAGWHNTSQNKSVAMGARNGARVWPMTQSVGLRWGLNHEGRGDRSGLFDDRYNCAGSIW